MNDAEKRAWSARAAQQRADRARRKATEDGEAERVRVATMYGRLGQKAGMPSARVRDLITQNRAPRVVRGPDATTTVRRQEWHAIPYDGMAHADRPDCWCIPTPDTSGPTYYRYAHRPNAPVETPDEDSPAWHEALRRREPR